MNGYELTPDGRKMLYSTGGGNWFIASTAGGGGAAADLAVRRSADCAGSECCWRRAARKLNFDTIEVRVDPRAEWKQIYEEAWRINRDYFYDPNMHGADWKADEGEVRTIPATRRPVRRRLPRR